jgi:putative transposase
VQLAGVTANPTGAWVAQQARNQAVALAEEATVVRFLLHDRDSKFTRAFDDIWHAVGDEVILTPIRPPTPTPSPSAGLAPCARSAWTTF